MRFNFLVALLIVSSTLSCKTVNKTGRSDLSFGGNEVDREQLQGYFVSVINQCTPYILPLAQGGTPFDVSVDPSKQQVVQKFVEIMLAQPKSEFDPSARLYKYYFGEQGQDLAPCGGEATEYLMLSFALRTNVLALTRNSSAELRILY